MATLKVNQIQDTSSNQYGFKNGTIIQVRNYMYTDTHVRSGNNEERMPNILGNGLAVITTHSNKNHIMIETTIQSGQVSTWTHMLYRFYYKLGESGSWTQWTDANMNSYQWNSSAQGCMRSTSNMAIFDPAYQGNIYFRITFQGNNSGDGLHINKANSNSSNEARNEYNVASTMTLSEIWQDS